MNKQDFKQNVFSFSERIYPMVARMLGGNHNAEDAIQEIMLKLWEKRNQVAKHPNIKGLVFLTARNYCIDVLRKKSLLVDDATSYLKVIKSSNDNSDIEWQELNRIIQEILKKLPEQQKEVFVMRDLDGYEFKEISATLEITVEHVRVLVSRARKFIGASLEKTYHYEQGK
ncbi:RNA polymerase sigma factor [Polaribacter litorisediminis]|uniref:RNA polymerase sigma factor n=1 Tax=Polaribacter litorisediminis TaxID=1908341 RepID=UPI001CBC5200|nr:RNA polymerase sigma factor [Polaribacter litorisediminis]UAM97618.1 RNA polymerase sigma factor [Polaribacter litorisediminis]